MQPEALIKTFIEEAFNKGNLLILGDIVHPQYQYSSPDSQLTGIDELKAFIQGFRSAFPDLNLEIDNLIACGEQTSTGFTLRGTHEGDFMGIPATHKPVEVQGIVMTKFKDNKIIEDWEILDNLSFLQQLGVVPELSS